MQGLAWPGQHELVDDRVDLRGAAQVGSGGVTYDSSRKDRQIGGIKISGIRGKLNA
jgi:hypothetical protein